MMPRPQVSIIIPAFNASSFLSEAANSAVAQTLSDLEIIIVDDASTDATLHIAQQLASVDSRIRIVALPGNVGLGPARNAGMQAAEGSYFMFLDADDFIEPDTASIAIDTASRTGADIVRFQLRQFASQSGPPISSPISAKAPAILERQADRRRAACALFADPEEDTPSNIGGSACTALYARRFFDEGLRFSSDRTCLSEDYLWNFECLMRARKVAYLPQVLYHYRIHPHSKTHTPDPLLMQHIAAYADESVATMTRCGLDAAEAEFLAMNYAASAMRGLGKRAILADAPISERRKWLRTQAMHPYTKKLKQRFSTGHLSRARRAAFYAFTHGQFWLLLLLTQARKLHPRRMRTNRG